MSRSRCPGRSRSFRQIQVELGLLCRVEIRRRIVGRLEVGARVGKAPIQPEPIEVLADVVMEADGLEVPGPRVAAPGEAGHASDRRRARRLAAKLEAEPDELAEVRRPEASEIERLAPLDGGTDVAVDLDVAAEVSLGECIGTGREDQAGDDIGTVDPDTCAGRRVPARVGPVVELDRQPMLGADRLGEDRHDGSGERGPAIEDSADRRPRRDHRGWMGLSLGLGRRVDRHRTPRSAMRHSRCLHMHDLGSACGGIDRRLMTVVPCDSVARPVRRLDDFEDLAFPGRPADLLGLDHDAVPLLDRHGHHLRCRRRAAPAGRPSGTRHHRANRAFRPVPILPIP
jgi:hypothetical protein